MLRRLAVELMRRTDDQLRHTTAEHAAFYEHRLQVSSGLREWIWLSGFWSLWLCGLLCAVRCLRCVTHNAIACLPAGLPL